LSCVQIVYTLIKSANIASAIIQFFLSCNWRR